MPFYVVFDGPGHLGGNVIYPSRDQGPSKFARGSRFEIGTQKSVIFHDMRNMPPSRPHLGKEALVLGGFALVSAVAYLSRLQSEAGAGDEDASFGWGGGGFMHAGGGMLPSTTRAARIDNPTARVTDRVFAAHAARLQRKPMRN